MQMRSLVKFSYRMNLIRDMLVPISNPSKSYVKCCSLNLRVHRYHETHAALPVHIESKQMLRQSPLSYKYKHGRGICTSGVLAKGKDRGKDKKKNAKRPIDITEMSQALNVDQLKEQCEKQITIFKDNLIKYASLRPTSGAIEELPVNFDGTTYTLQEVASVARKSNVIVISVTDFPQVIPNILKSFRENEQNLNPQQDGTTLYVTLPKITKEFRQSMIKNCNAHFLKFREAIREIRNKNVKKLKKNEENHPVDLTERVQDNLELFIQQYIRQAEEILEKKQKDLQGEE